tara:strand:- start:2071 stop:3015 length:945 start_codon:yes stop_codon:yes gene_type:complete
MKNFIKLKDLNDFNKTLSLAFEMKKNINSYSHIGNNKTLGMIFFNPSLRTRLSTQKAANLLGINIMIMNFDSEAWTLEFEDGTKMSGIKSEHIKEAAGVISQYCDIVGIRAFASLKNKKNDEEEVVLNNFVKYSTIPVINMESATAHPLQALADAMTINEHKNKNKPKIVLSWAPHPKALPHAVANSFINMMKNINSEFVIANPEGYDLDPKITDGIKIYTNQKEAFEGADFVYAKNWCSYQEYGKILKKDEEWMINNEIMKHTNDAKFMHCLPIRRNIVASDEVLDNKNSLVLKQSENRVYACQAILKQLIDD